MSELHKEAWVKAALDATDGKVLVPHIFRILDAVAPMIREECAKIADAKWDVQVNRFVVHGTPLKDERGNEHFVALEDVNDGVRKAAAAIRGAGQ